MITLTVHIHAQEGHVADLSAAIEENSFRTFEDEPGCLAFDVVQDVTDEHHFIFHEVYVDEGALASVFHDTRA